MICNLGVVGSNPTRGSEEGSGEIGFYLKYKGEYQSGQMGQTVNLLAFAFGGSNPSAPTNKPSRLDGIGLSGVIILSCEDVFAKMRK